MMGSTDFLIDNISMSIEWKYEYLLGLDFKKLREEENKKILAQGGKPALGKISILGITKAAIYTDSWLSAASFEQTTDVLTEASLLGREDHLIGLKENVIIGRLIPVSPERAQMPQG